MFALQLLNGSITDTGSGSIALVRRPRVVLGGNDRAHLELHQLANSPEELEIVRGPGRKFSVVKRVSGRADVASRKDFYARATVEVGPVALEVTALDVDLQLAPDEAFDRGCIRIMRAAARQQLANYPALYVQYDGGQPALVSLPSDAVVVLGRRRECHLRVDAPDVSGLHARIGVEGGTFWVEDLGSTNGTFIGKQQVAGKIAARPGSEVVLGRSTTIKLLASPQQLETSTTPPVTAAVPQTSQQRTPCLVTTAEGARPSRVMLSPGTAFSIGRDQTNDMLIGQPFISRRHCAVLLTTDGAIRVTDSSTNGTVVNDRLLKSGPSDLLPLAPCVLDLGGGVTVAICPDEPSVARFLRAKGARDSFENRRVSPGLGRRSLSAADAVSSARELIGSYFALLKKGSKVQRFTALLVTAALGFVLLLMFFLVLKAL